MLSVLTINIQAAALPRARALAAWLDGRAEDVFVLTETSNGPGTAYLLDQCRTAGWHIIHTPDPDRDRGCALISRLALTPRQDLTATITIPGRAVAATLDVDPSVTILGLYVPSSDRAPEKLAKKRAFLASVTDTLRAMPASARAGLLVAGDFNVIDRDHQPAYKAFLAFEYQFLDDLADLDLLDVHRHLYPGVQVHSWLGREGNGYRFDYVHVGADLIARLVSCDYLHQPREQNLSDHAAVTISLRAELAGDRPATGALSSAGGLF